MRTLGHAFVAAVVAGLLSVASSVPAAADPTPWSDPRDDVSLANADLVGGLAAVDTDTVYLRATFATLPFPDTATHHLGWCLDLDGNASTGRVCGGVNGYLLYGADAAVALENVPPRSPPLTIEVMREGAAPILPDVASTVLVDAATNTVCVTLPLAFLADDGAFHYAVTSAFGGSFGRNDAAPDAPGFDSLVGFFSSDAGDPGPCGGSSGNGGPPGGTGGPPPATGDPNTDTGTPSTLTDLPLSASPSAQSPWWIAPVLIVTAFLAFAGVARRRGKRPPR